MEHFLLSFICLWLPLAVHGVGVGTASKLDSEGKPWFRLLTSYRVVGAQELLGVSFVGGAGPLLSKEEVVSDASGVVSYSWEQHQTSTRFALIRGEKDWELDLNGARKKLSRKDYPALVVPPMLASMLERLASGQGKGRRTKFQLLVPDRLDVFTFEFEESSQGHWVLRPVNFFVRAVAGVIPFEVDPTGALRAIKNFHPPVKYRDSKGRLTDEVTDLSFSSEVAL